MSYSWLTVRGGSMNPSSLKFAALMNKQNIAENELFKPEQLRPKAIAVNTDDTVLLQDPFMFTKLRTVTQRYGAHWEPDGVYLKLWLRFNHIARYLKDESFTFRPFEPGVSNPVIMHGNPKLCKGPDDGVKGGRIVTEFNSDPNHLDYVEVLNPDEGLVGMQEATVGFSQYVDFMLKGEPVQDNGQDPTIWFHVDDVNGDNGTCIRIGTARQFIVATRRGGATQVCKKTPDNVIQSNVWNRACIKYDFNGSVIGIKVNNIPYTLVNATNQSFPSSHENSVFIGVGQNLNGRFPGRIADVRWYRDLIFWTEHETNIWNNYRSICAAPVIRLNNTTDYVDFGNDSSLWSTSLTKFSFAFWVWMDDLGSADRIMLAHDTTAFGGADHTWICYRDSGDLTQIRWYIIGTGANFKIAAFSGSAVAKKWTHIGGTYDNSLGSQNIKIYVGAVLGDRADTLTETINASKPFFMGSPVTSLGQPGYYKDLRFWKTTALTQSQMEKVMNNRPDAPLPSYWIKMVEMNGNPVDFITRTKIGTLTNGASWEMGATPHPTEYGSLSVAGYTRFHDALDAGGYDSTGYDSTGFDTS